MDIGEAGRHSDGGVLSHSAFGQALEENTLCIPTPTALPGGTCHIVTTSMFYQYISSSGSTQPPLPYVFVGDEAFPLHNMLRPYPGRNLPGMPLF